jgi:hypothetical protein
MILRRGLGIWRRREGVYSINLGHGKKKLFCSLYDHNMQNESRWISEFSFTPGECDNC